MEFCLLGPLLVRRDGAPVAVCSGKQRVLLTALLLNANHVVPDGQLAEILWGARIPPSARASLHNHVMRLRRALGDAGHSRIVRQDDGYLISVRAGELDVDRFEASVDAAREAARRRSWAEAAEVLRTALSLWRGEPLPDASWAAAMLQEVPRLAEKRLQALEARIDADLHLGCHADVIAEVRLLAAAHPLREHLYVLLMLALYRCGRRAEALAAYQQARRVLVDEAGVEPGTELRELHQRVLAADPALAGPAGPVSAATPPSSGNAHPEPAAAGAASPGAVVPRQLPGPAPYFVGRQGELASLTQALDRAGRQAPGTVVISVVGGTAGVGKTALAVHWAHQVAERFPDGQLYVNLRGFDPSGTPAAPAEVIREFLEALGVPTDRTPNNMAGQAGLYRSVVAGRRLLIVLDNARDEQQVRPLLPAGPQCMVVVTSRSQLAGLAAADGACLLSLDLLSHAEARQMLSARLGAGRAAAQPDAIAEIARLCARLPLALAVATARSSTHPALPLPELAAELRDTQGRLDILDTGDPAASVRAAFSWSAGRLTPDAAKMFRLLGLHPGPDISVPAAASLAGTSPADTRRSLAELARAHLITEHLPGRYGFHDLLRAYAAGQAAATDSDADRCAATGRALDHYLHTAHAAAVLIDPTRDPIPVPAPRPGVRPEHLADHQQALAWLQAEHQVLLAAITLADSTGSDVHAWQIPWTMSDFLHRRGHWRQKAAIQRTAVAAATRLGDQAGQAVSLRLLSQACVSLGEYGQAAASSAAALRLCQQLGNHAGEANVHLLLAVIARDQGRQADGLSHNEQALRLYQASATGPESPTCSTTSSRPMPCSATTSRPTRSASKHSSCR